MVQVWSPEALLDLVVPINASNYVLVTNFWMVSSFVVELRQTPFKGTEPNHPSLKTALAGRLLQGSISHRIQCIKLHTCTRFQDNIIICSSYNR